MSKIFQQKRLFKHKNVEFAEEVGVDIADALELIDIKSTDLKKGSRKPNIQNKETFKIEKDKFENEKSKLKNIWKEKEKPIFVDINPPAAFKNSYSNSKLNHDFIELLQNELQNTPASSSLILSQWLKNPSMGK